MSTEEELETYKAYAKDLEEQLEDLQERNTAGSDQIAMMRNEQVKLRQELYDLRVKFKQQADLTIMHAKEKDAAIRRLEQAKESLHDLSTLTMHSKRALGRKS